MRVIALALLLTGCAAQAPQVVHVTWVKSNASPPRAERVGEDACWIQTGTRVVDFELFGRLFRECLEAK